MNGPSLVEINRELAERSLYEFIRQAWPIVEPADDFMPNWHIEAIALHLQAVTEGKIKRLLINIPPGHAKSLIVSVFWPAWVWLKDPKWRALFGSYAMDLAIRDSVRCRDLMQSEWYQDTFRPNQPKERDGKIIPAWEFSGDQNVKSYFKNTCQGFRFSLSVGSQGTGWRGNCVVVDDPLNAKDQWSETIRKEAIRWWDKTMSSRLNDPRKGARVIIMQRLHEEDLSGHVLAKGGYEHLCLPSEFEPARRSVTSIGWQDPRTKEGELLFPTLFTQEVLDEAKKDLGSSDYAGQHEQRPAPAEGEIIKVAWLRYYDRLPLRFDRLIQSWDCSFKDLKGSSFVVGTVWGQVGAQFYLIDRFRRHVDLPGTCTAIRNMTATHPRALTKLVEDKANGPAVIQSLRLEVPGLLPVSVTDSKEARAFAVQPLFEAGNVLLPCDAPWLDEYVHELTTFPGAAHDDQVDSTTQALNWLMGNRKRKEKAAAGGERKVVTQYQPR